MPSFQAARERTHGFRCRPLCPPLLRQPGARPGQRIPAPEGLGVPLGVCLGPQSQLGRPDRPRTARHHRPAPGFLPGQLGHVPWLLGTAAEQQPGPDESAGPAALQRCRSGTLRAVPGGFRRQRRAPGAQPQAAGNGTRVDGRPQQPGELDRHPEEQDPARRLGRVSRPRPPLPGRLSRAVSTPGPDERQRRDPHRAAPPDRRRKAVVPAPGDRPQGSSTPPGAWPTWLSSSTAWKTPEALRRRSGDL